MAVQLTLRRPHGRDLTALTFDQQRVRIGRGRGCDFRIPHATVSVEHAMVILEGDRYFLVDVGSTNGTRLGGEVLVLQRRKLLRTGDLIEIAGFELEFRAGVPMVSHHSQDRTAAAARALANQLLGHDEQELIRPSLVVANGPQEGQRFELPEPPGAMVVGRATACDLALVDSEVSRRHLRVETTAEGAVARDLGGKNPLMINGRQIERQRLHDRDELLLGATTLIFDDPVEAYLKDLASLPEDQTDRAVEPIAEPPPDEPEPEMMEAEISSEAARAPGEATDPLQAHPAIEAHPPAGGDPIDTGGERAETSPGGEPSASSPSPERPRNFLGASTGSEVAILLVGALALAACVAALVWIFR